MIATVQSTPTSLRVVMTRDAADRTRNGRATSAAEGFGVWAPDGVDLGGVHPDLVVLAVVLVAQPWVRRRLVVRGVDGVSAGLADAVHARFGFELDAGGAVEPRVAPGSGRPGLAYSGGVDSTAAMMLLPGDTPLVFLNRVGPDRTSGDGVYRSTAALRGLRELTALGHEVHAVDSDLEYTRDPTGFPTHPANAVPALLLADRLRLRSISWGTILEAAYRVGSDQGFVDRDDQPATATTAAMFAAVGVPISPVVEGLSEVATSTIVRGSPYETVARSCIRGADRPCRRCKKCLRKSLLDSALASPSWSTGRLDRYYGNESVRRELTTVPLHHENVYGYLLAGYHGDDPVLRALADLVQVDRGDHTLFERFYPPYLDALPAPDRSHVARVLAEHLAPMTEAEITRLQQWRPVGRDGYDPARHERLTRALQRYDTTAARLRSLPDRLRPRARLRRGLRSVRRTPAHLGDEVAT